MKITKRTKAIMENTDIDKNKYYSPKEAVEIIKGLSTSKFDETLDLSIQLGIDPKKSDQQIKIATVPPNPLGKKIKILVICNGDHVKKAESAGADFVGAEDMIEKVLTEKWVGFDVVICIPELMPKVAKLGQVLGPKGIMPSPKMGTVTNDVEKAIKDAKAGRIELKNDKLGLVNFPFGKKSFEITKILDNLYFLVQSLNKSKPASSKGNYLKKVSVSSTMGPGFKIDISLLKEELKEYNGASA
ncbi:50S ribosomal protein L1 [bacterium]|jgi:large subunit ribosomal protein L1|nr:50S ribosomal protein L1 [bacterium]MBT3849910.1 50S ribosomal protein L1 [bacterium]MBT4435433.1 50S ribosomal protein L1 [bacterium]MDG2445313.1 50S ribosomal protein L1 [Thermodesulfobacteriota bacterium]|tara:strand:- start:942 stop:1673 length:732 start_codon:yes stop_codon:yes gene_type:complete